MGGGGLLVRRGCLRVLGWRSLHSISEHQRLWADLLGSLGSAVVSGGPFKDPWVICNEENASASLCFENMRIISLFMTNTICNIM